MDERDERNKKLNDYAAEVKRINNLKKKNRVLIETARLFAGALLSRPEHLLAPPGDLMDTAFRYAEEYTRASEKAMDGFNEKHKAKLDEISTYLENETPNAVRAFMAMISDVEKEMEKEMMQ